MQFRKFLEPHATATQKPVPFSSQGHIFEPNIEPNIEPNQSCADMLKCVVVDMKCAQRQHFTFTRTRNLFDSLEPNEHGEHVMVLMDLETVLDESTFPT